ncbi:MAG: DUF362 domain-containing protein [Spirochaetales bacterium]|nr:DUF362 domain-containing protein [Spirochaetales bacterium]
MADLIKKRFFLTCGKTGKIKGIKKMQGLWKLLIPVTGFLALIWYLLRVIPKPQRSMYPCMRVAAPLAGSFLGYVLSITGLVLVIKKFKKIMKFGKILWKKKIIVATGCVALGLAALVINMNFAADSVWADSPVGTAKGIFAAQGKSRVAYCRDRSAVSAPVSAADWWANQYNDQNKINALVTAAVKSVGNSSSEATAWDNLFKDFNSTHGRGSIGYSPGEKIAVKINMNNTGPGMGGNGGREDTNQIDASPQMIIALTTSLKTAGVPENMITFSDPSRFIPYHMQQIVRGAGLSGVILEGQDNFGDSDLRASTYTAEGTLVYSNGTRTGNPSKIARSFADATYVIDMAILKGHSYNMTLCGKNFFGATGISSNPMNNFDNFHNSMDTSPYVYVDYFANRNLGGKTLLWIIDTLYGSKEAYDTDRNADGTYHGVDDKWPMFGNEWPGMVLMSQDPVAIDSVAIDFFAANFADLNPIGNGWDRYLLEAANPASYNYVGPDGTGKLTASLGIYEHWNNSTDKQYSGNLGGTGIELEDAASTTPAVLKGDVNGNNAVDIIDALITAQYYAGLDPSVFNQAAADVNCYGSIDIVDALRIAQYYVGLISSFDC